jgi:hypothetical protein
MKQDLTDSEWSKTYPFFAWTISKAINLYFREMVVALQGDFQLIYVLRMISEQQYDTFLSPEVVKLIDQGQDWESVFASFDLKHLSVQDIQKLCLLDEATVSSALHKLEQLDMVTRNADGLWTITFKANHIQFEMGRNLYQAIAAEKENYEYLHSHMISS